MKSRIVVLPFYHLTEARTTTASVVMTLFLPTLVGASLPTRFILNEISERLNSACRCYFGASIFVYVHGSVSVKKSVCKKVWKR